MPRVTSDFTAEDGLKWERYAEKCKLFHAGKANHPGAPPEGYISVYLAMKQKYAPLPEDIPSLCFARAPTSGPAVSMSDTAFGRSKGPGGFQGSRGGHRGGYQGDRGKTNRGAYHPKNFAKRVSPPRKPKTKSYDCRKNRRKQQREQKGDNKIPVSEGGPAETYGNDVQEGSSGTFTLGEDEFTTSYDLIDDSEPMGCA
ncbi:hypothetical protein BC835DRAFT_1416633 [Cytidiella melzeri]|nr:hypothetical protein BC835DRAFT_1416633 [Cytidiella melzeri]